MLLVLIFIHLIGLLSYSSLFKLDYDRSYETAFLLKWYLILLFLPAGTNAGIWELSSASAEEGDLFGGKRKEKEKEGKNT